MSHEKPHRRLSLTQPTAVPTHPARAEDSSPEVRDLERSLRAELSAIQIRVEDWDARLIRVAEVLESAIATQRAPVTRTFRSAGLDTTLSAPRLTVPTSCPDTQEEPVSPPPLPACRERKIRIATRSRRAQPLAREETTASGAVPIPCPPDDPNGQNGPVRVRAVPAIDPPLDRIPILVRDMSGRANSLSPRAG